MYVLKREEFSNSAVSKSVCRMDGCYRCTRIGLCEHGQQDMQ